jgi:DMSO/TMAO reductase YedYZ heme-binding membrane subunit
MLQRRQTLWLLLAAVSAVLTFKYSFFSGNKGVAPDKPFQYLTATSNMVILILSVALVSAIVIDIFLYKNRKLQLRIALAAAALSVLNIFLYYRETKKFAVGEGNYDLTSILVFAIPVFLIFAISGIYKDQKLVKSLDRLR